MKHNSMYRVFLGKRKPIVIDIYDRDRFESLMIGLGVNPTEARFPPNMGYWIEIVPGVGV